VSYCVTNFKYPSVTYVISRSQSVLYESAGIRGGWPGDRPVSSRQSVGPGLEAGPFLYERFEHS